jgi:hypothetical protein
MDGVGVGVGDDVPKRLTVQPATDSEATITSIIMANNFFSMQAPLDGKINQIGKNGTMV